MLQPGMHADFVLLNVDLMKATPAEIRGGKVIQTWIGGVPVYDGLRPNQVKTDAR